MSQYSKAVRMKVLLVDDDLALIDSIQQVLALYEIDAFSVTNKYKMKSINLEQIDCIFLDFLMDDWDGIQAVEMLRHKSYSGGLVLMSGMSNSILSLFKQAVKAAGLDFWGILEKPLTTSSIVKILNAKLIAGRQDNEPVTKKEIQSALNNHGCITLFQSKVELASQSTIGFEVLSRIRLENGRILYPDTFLSLLKQYDLWNLFNQTVVRTAMREIQNSRYKNFPLALNFSIEHLICPDFVASLVNELNTADYSTNNLTIEITEDMAIQHNIKVKESFDMLKSLGVKLSLDDFGSAYNSFRQLTEYNFDEFKLDKYYVQNCNTSSKCNSILESALLISNTFDIPLVLEGMETSEQFEHAKSLGAKFAQGYLFGKPVPLSYHQDTKLIIYA